MKRIYSVIFSNIFSICFGANIVLADLISYEFIGSIDSISGNVDFLDGIISEGDVLTGTITVDTEALVIGNGSPMFDVYFNVNQWILVDSEVLGGFYQESTSDYVLYAYGLNTNSNLPIDQSTWDETRILLPSAPVEDWEYSGDIDWYAIEGGLIFETLSMCGGDTYRIDANFHAIPSAPVPEPATLLLVGAGFSCFIGSRFRRKNK